MACLILRRHFHCIALDQRGHGDTGWTPEGQLEDDNGELMKADTEAFIDHLAYPRVVLCGMSMGGSNALRYAPTHPDRLYRLVIVDIAPDTMIEGQLEMEAFRRETETMRSFEDFLDRAVKFNPQRQPAHLKYSLLHSLKQVPDGWTWKQDARRHTSLDAMTDEERQAMRQRHADSLWSDVKGIATPTLLLRGVQSKILSKAAADAMVSAMVDAEQVLIPNAGHSVQGDNPRAFAEELLAFIERRGLEDAS